MTPFPYIRVTVVAVLFHTSVIVSSQEIFSQELGVSGASLWSMIELSDGNILTSGVLDNNLYMVKWGANGDTLWTKHHPLIPPSGKLMQLSDGRIFTGTHIFNDVGEIEQQFSGIGWNAIQLEDSSLLLVDQDSLRKTDLDGNIQWSKKIILPEWPVEHTGTLLGTFDNGILTYSSLEGGGPVNSTHALLLGRYDHNGVLLDTARVYNNDYTGWLILKKFRPLETGGYIGISSTATATATMIRLSSEGEVVWTNTFGMGVGTDPFIHPDDITGTYDDRIVVSGPSDPQIDSLGNIGHWLRLAEFDGAGELICIEDVRWNEEQVMQNMVDIISGVAGVEFHVLSRTESENTIIGYNDLCLTTSFNEYFDLFEVMVQPGHLQLVFLDDKECHWTIHNIAGQRITGGRSNTTRLIIPTHDLTAGAYTVTISDRDGRRGVRKVVILN